MFHALVLAVLISAVQEEDKAAPNVDAQKSLQTIGDAMVGGVWTEKTPGEVTSETRYTWLMGRRFLQVAVDVQEKPSSHAIIGVEPDTQKLTWWWFFAGGATSKSVAVAASDKQWTFITTGAGAELETRHTLLSKDEMKSERLRFVRNGENQKLRPPIVLVRKRD